MKTRMKHLLSLALLALLAAGCVEEPQAEPEIIAGLSYTPVKGLIPRKTVTVDPQIENGTPENFAIHSVLFGERLLKPDEMFGIDAVSGTITVSAPTDVEAGEYIVSITCTMDGRNYIFKNVLSVTVIPGMPEVRIDPEQLNLRFEDLSPASEAALPFVSIVPETEAAEITGLEVRNLRRDGEAVGNVSELLSADASASIVSFLKSDSWTLGTYVADLKVSTESFPEESEVGLVKDALKFTVAAMPVKMSYPDAPDFYQNTGAEYVPVFEDDVVPSDIALKSVTLNGETFDYGTMFAVDAVSGVISVTAAVDAPVGEYRVSLSYSYAGQDLSSDDVLAVRCIAGLPSSLKVEPQPSSIEIKDLAAGSAAVLPSYTIIPEGESSPVVSYSIAAARHDGAGFDWQGRFSLEGATVSIIRGEWETGEYTLDLRCVTEAVGAERERGVYASALRISVFEKVDLKYDDEVRKEHTGWSILPATPMPAGYVYSFSEPSADYVSELVIDASTGAVSAVKGNSLSQGSYTVKIAAEAAGLESSEAEFTLEIVKNPYYFTYFSYGNNLGLSEEQTRGASQFRFGAEADLIASTLPVRYKDWDDASGVTFKAERKLNVTPSVAGNGELSFEYARNSSGVETPVDAQAIGILFVTASTTDPEDADNSWSVTIPVAVDYSKDAATNVRYNPFLLRVNPEVGARSSAPEISGAAVVDIDYRRTFNYFNIAGSDKDGEAFVSGAPNAAGSFLSHIWDRFSEDTGLNKSGGKANYGGKVPMSYYDGKTDASKVPTLKNEQQLKLTPAYVSPDDRSIVVNPDLWQYNGGWADGVFTGQITYTVSASAAVNNGTQIFPVAIWLDPNYE